MAEISHRMPEPAPQIPEVAIAPPRRTATTGADRCYVRLAVMGDRPSWRANGPRSSDWPRQLARVIASAHDLSWWDVRSGRASVYDIRRVQLRAAVAHRPHLVAMATGLVDARSREWDVAEVRSHLLHCARVISERGAVLLTTRLDVRHPHLLAAGGPARLRSRVQQLNGVHEELHERFGTIHLDPTSAEGPDPYPRGAGPVDRFARELARRGLDLPAAPGGFSGSGPLTDRARRPAGPSGGPGCPAAPGRPSRA